MVRIESRVEINADADKIWGIISDIDGEPKFWKGTTSVRNISKDGNTVKREITIAFRNQKCLQTVTILANKSIVAEFTEGVIIGTKTTTLVRNGKKTDLETVWDVKMSGMMGMFTGMVKRHIKKGTDQALHSIKEAAEG